jgi:hypothetical protein
MRFIGLSCDVACASAFCNQAQLVQPVEPMVTIIGKGGYPEQIPVMLSLACLPLETTRLWLSEFSCTQVRVYQDLQMRAQLQQQQILQQTYLQPAGGLPQSLPVAQYGQPNITGGFSAPPPSTWPGFAPQAPHEQQKYVIPSADVVPPPQSVPGYPGSTPYAMPPASFVVLSPPPPEYAPPYAPECYNAYPSKVESGIMAV